MKPELKKYQVEALEDFEDSLKMIQKKRARLTDDSPVLVRQARWGIQVTAPTGAGKTVLAGEIIDRFLNDHIILVLSPGSGNLEEQTAKSLSAMLPGRVQKLSGTILQTLPLAVGDVYVSNWEALVSTSNKQNAYITKIAKMEQEQRNIWDWLDAIGQADIPFALIIDESHHGAKSASGSINAFLKDITRHLGKPPFYVELSATPAAKSEQYTQTGGLLETVTIPVHDVIKAGMIRKTVMLNWGVQNELDTLDAKDLAATTTEELVLRRALKTRDELEIEYKRVGSPYTPALGIQLPSSAEGKAARKRLENILYSITDKPTGAPAYYYNKDNERGNIGVYMADEKSEGFDEISSSDSPIKVFFYKQGITMGWDCPRAQVLVGYRHLQSRVFEKQNLGRFLRTTEHKHYNHELIDNTYVYTNMKDVDLGAAGFKHDLETAGTSYGDIQHRRSFNLKDGTVYKAFATLDALGLESYRIRRSHPQYIQWREIVRLWNKTSNVKEWANQLVSPPAPDQTIASGQVNTHDLVTHTGDTGFAAIENNSLLAGYYTARQELNGLLLADTRDRGGDRFKPAAGILVAYLLRFLEDWMRSAMRLRSAAGTPDLSHLTPPNRNVDMIGYIDALWAYKPNYVLLREALYRMVDEAALIYPPRAYLDESGNKVYPANTYTIDTHVYLTTERQEIAEANYDDEKTDLIDKTYQGVLAERNAWGPDLKDDDVYRPEKKKASQPELDFEDYIAHVDGLITFAKNARLDGNVFALTYSVDDEDGKKYYGVEPDYFFEYELHGKIIVVIAEVKDKDGSLDAHWKKKAERLSDLQQKYPGQLIAGVVRKVGTRHVISQRINDEIDVDVDLDSVLQRG